ncbi:unnamed protein product [Lampetra fluviatilis]
MYGGLSSESNRLGSDCPSRAARVRAAGRDFGGGGGEQRPRRPRGEVAICEEAAALHLRTASADTAAGRSPGTSAPRVRASLTDDFPTPITILPPEWKRPASPDSQESRARALRGRDAWRATAWGCAKGAAHVERTARDGLPGSPRGHLGAPPLR